MSLFELSMEGAAWREKEELWSSKIRHDESKSVYFAPDGMLVLQKSRL